MKIVINYYLVILIFVLYSSCSEKIISDKDIKAIYSDYCAEEIIYFYETAFNTDPEARSNTPKKEDLFKWEDDIFIQIKGDYSRADSCAVSHACIAINSVGLPVNISIDQNNESQNVNMQIYFYPIDTLREKGLYDRDTTKIGARGSYLKIFGSQYATIGIPTDVFNSILQKSVVMEEIVQCLGIRADSYTYPNSVFYQGVNKTTEFLPIDIKVLQLLYEPFILNGMKKKDFYKAFSDILPTNSILLSDYQKFENHIQQADYSTESIKLFLSTAFCSNSYNNEQHIQKWRGPIIVDINGSYTAKDSIFLLAAIDSISSLSGQNISILKQGADLVANAGFSFHSKMYFNNPNYYVSRKWAYLGVAYQLYFGNLVMKHNEYPEKTRQLLMAKQLAILSGLNIPDKQIGNWGSTFFSNKFSPKGRLFSATDKDVFKLFFNPIVKPGMEKKEILKILMRYYPLEEFAYEVENYSVLQEYLNLTLKDSSFVNKFVKYIGLNSNKNSKLSKLSSGICIEIKNSPSKKYIALVDSVLSQFNQLDIEMKFERILEGEGIPNVEIYFADSEKVKYIFDDAPKLSRNNLQTFYFKSDFNDFETRFQSARIIICRNDKIENIEANLLLIFLHILHIDIADPKEVFLDLSIDNSAVLSDNVKKTLEVFYNPNFQSGMNNKKILKLIDNLN